MSLSTKGVVIVAAKRTAFGTFGGKFVNTTACDLQVASNKAAMAAAKITPEMIDTVNIGNILSHSSTDGGYMGRHSALKSGIPIDRPALMVNRLCGSGFQAVVNGVQDILLGAAKISLTGGAESMSQAPFVVRNVRFGTQLGVNYNFEDTLWAALSDSYCKLPMGLTAEKLGAQNNVTREDVDEFSLRSQMLWKKAQEAGVFKEELVPVQIKGKKGPENVECDEHPRPNTTMEGLKKLRSLFKENGLVTAGTASGVSDGAGTVIVASDAAAAEYNLKPLARILGYSTVGVDPSIMGVGPVPAIQNVLKVCGLTLNDIDLVEINEAFAAQTLACARQLNLDINKLNVNGGAIALGHPLAASGARITTHLVHELRRRKAKYGIGSACIGGGQGIALLIEALY
ncbi:hypothetical protein PPYR_02682 [Photinus pyralis]|uniref:3-ketoacyl-CoA thiolase, mitochondrial n=1 Tax=Photinus pyralis TaxID=7054 RepID=A0A1Y1NHJ6_PHOPY|nr:3-ketoacyl-CoA thiolase, mitochondrial-like [Photinus pyralis]KAB0805712.1 hypothetical protein PPYR_02682 [Photinus pyralis]